MAGNYPDAPGNRLAWDRDGTYLGWADPSLSSVGALTPDFATAWNGEGLALKQFSMGARYFIFMFPRPMDIVAGLFSGDVSPTTFATSANTTSGIDGTWTSATSLGSGPVTKTGLRSAVIPCSLTGITALRFYQQYGRLYAAHLYGKPSTIPVDNLVLYDATTATRVTGAYFDFGDVRQGSTSIKQFRVHNNSTTKTANSVTVSCEALTDTSPSVPVQYTFSTDGTTYSGTVTIPSIAAGVTSPTIYVKRIAPSNAVLSLWWTRIVASAASWA